jgi:hypothetical protein
VTDAQRRTFLCRGSPVRARTTGASTIRLPISRTAAHLRHRHAGWCVTTTDVPTKVRMSMLTLMLTTRHSYGGRPKTSLLRSCCCAAARSLQPLRSDVCANN